MENGSDESLLWNLSAVAENYFNQVTEKSCVFPFQAYVVLVFYDVSAKEIHHQTEEILNQCTLTHPDLSLSCGMGSVMTSVEKMHISFDHAFAAMLYAVNQGKRSLSFDEMDEFQLFYSCQDQSVLEQFTSILQPLERYEQHGNQLTETLRLYLNSNGSINQVSEAMVCHRNTINYRIKKISELLGEDLDSMQIRFQLQLALSIRDYQRLYHIDETT
jgi:DNA-binding PucR family transcriptional regulator